MKLIYKTDKMAIVHTEEKGFCVLANDLFHSGDLIAINVAIPVSNEDKLSQNWRMNSGHKEYDVIALGPIQLMNHDKNSNVRIERADNIFTAFAKRRIEFGEELTIHYECPLWFEPKPSIKLTID